MASGMSANVVSRIGLPLSMVSTAASVDEILLHPVGDLVEDLGALGRRGLAPGIFRGVSCVERELDVCGAAIGDLTDRLAGDRADIVEIAAVDRRHPFAADEILVARPQRCPRIQGLDDLVQHGLLPWNA